MPNDIPASLADEALPMPAQPVSAGRRPEIRALTSLRGIAALIVVLYHFRDQFAPLRDLQTYTSFLDYGWIMVDFFFLLSGFVMMLAYSDAFKREVSSRNYFKFMQNRLARIYPLHLFTLLCFIALECAKYVYMPANLDPPFSKNYPASIVTNLLLIQAWGFDSDQTWNWASWSISAEFAAYILFPFIVLIAPARRPLLNLLLIPAAIIALYGIKSTIGDGSIDLTFNLGVIRCLPSFVLGMAVFNLLSICNEEQRSLLGSDLLLYGAIAICVLLLHWRENEMLVILSFALLIATASLNTSSHGAKLLSSSPFYFLGVISYSVYMTHSLILRLWRLAITKVSHYQLSFGISIVSLAVLTSLVICVSWLTFKFIENPGRRLFKVHCRAGRA